MGLKYFQSLRLEMYMNSKVYVYREYCIYQECSDKIHIGWSLKTLRIVQSLDLLSYEIWVLKNVRLVVHTKFGSLNPSSESTFYIMEKETRTHESHWKYSNFQDMEIYKKISFDLWSLGFKECTTGRNFWSWILAQKPLWT